VLLLGEAPSHRGCRFTGIPFCSEVELTHKAALVAREPLALTSAAPKPMSERSAAIVWDEMQRAACAREVVLWNAFPWHPYRDEVATNRKPRLSEVKQGRPAFEALLRCFTHPIDVFAIGKVAEAALATWEGFRCAGYLRHPSMGGESRFRAQFRQQVVAHLQS
ncbi:MAG TPA: uracil-DNA glycosylase, partial [Usitatibacter sp.]|nr:uracil-DNA glycosylase [Usitatibacter sp.]